MLIIGTNSKAKFILRGLWLLVTSLCYNWLKPYSFTWSHSSQMFLLSTLQGLCGSFTMWLMDSVSGWCHGSHKKRNFHELELENSGKARQFPCVCHLPCELSDLLGDTEESRIENREGRKRRGRSRICYLSPVLSSRVSNCLGPGKKTPKLQTQGIKFITGQKLIPKRHS